MGKRFFDKKCKYSIRKFSVGVASVMIGATFFASPVALGAEVEGEPSTENGAISEAPSLKQLPDEVLKAIEKAEKEGQTKQKRKIPLLQKKEQPPLRLGKLNPQKKKQLSRLKQKQQPLQRRLNQRKR